MFARRLAKRATQLEGFDELAGTKFFASGHPASQFKRMGYDDQDRVVLFGYLHKQLTDLLRVLSIEIAGWFIGQDQCRFQ